MQMLEVMMPAGDHRVFRGLPLAFHQLGNGLMRRNIVVGDFHLAVAEHLQREIGNHLFRNPLARVDRILAPDGWAGRKNFDECKARAVALQFEGFAHGPARFHDVLVVGERDAFDVDRCLERRNQLGHVHGEAFVHRAASPGRSGAALADERGGGHLAASHAVDRVVDEENGDLFSAIGGMDDLGRADRGEVAISLIGDHNLVRAGALQSGSGSGSAAMRHLHVAHVKIVVSENGTADRTHQDGLILQAEVFESFGNQFVDHAVAAPGTIVRLMTQVRLAFVLGIEDL